MHYQRCKTYPDKMCDNWPDSTACTIRYEAPMLMLKVCVFEHMNQSMLSSNCKSIYYVEWPV